LDTSQCNGGSEWKRYRKRRIPLLKAKKNPKIHASEAKMKDGVSFRPKITQRRPKLQYKIKFYRKKNLEGI